MLLFMNMRKNNNRLCDYGEANQIKTYREVCQ